ncbi:SPOR domain-containing protein [Maricaulaceae bacterium EIL42A08]|nr:SPOR domain-containing protein [Maricaulaceae bacterium EIL42A08]
MTSRFVRATVVAAACVLSACATDSTERPDPIAPLRGPQETIVETDYTAALRCLGQYVRAQSYPAPRIAVGHISDMTGATDYFNGARVTQGASLMAITALSDAGVRVVERFDMGVIQAEMNYAQTGLVRDSQTQLRELNPGMLQGADLYIVGGLTEFNPNIRSRGSDLYGADERATGAAASIGFNTHTIDVAMDVRLVDATSSEVLSVRALRKQIVGREIELGVFEFMSGGVVDLAAGQRALEPVQTAVRTMIDRAIFEFVGSLYNLPADACLDGRSLPVQSPASLTRGHLADPQARIHSSAASVSEPADYSVPAPRGVQSSYSRPPHRSESLATSEIGMHLASYRNPENARRGWTQLQSGYRAELEGLLPLIVPTEIEGRGLYYRLIAGPVLSLETARAQCAALEAQNQYCQPISVG